jgi:hypothetical protein
MKLEDLEEVTKLRNHRRNAIRLRDASESHPLVCTLGWSPDPMDVARHISVMPIRETIKREAETFIAETDAKLRSLGVEP